MKKIYLLALSAVFGLSAMAQVSVTFQVDMNNVDVSADGVHVAGDWQSEAGVSDDWQPDTAEMTDDDSDGIYSLTVDLPVGQYEYKFVNGNAWGSDESVPQINKTGGSDNRFFVVTSYHETDGFVIPAVVYGGTAPAGEVAVRLVADLSNQDVISENGVHVAGDLFAQSWTPEYAAMFSGANNRFVYVANVAPNATYSYKFINGNDWGGDEWYGVASPEECTTDGNRTVTLEEADVTLDVVCFESCSTCAPLTEVTFKVNLTLEGGGNVDGVSIAGSFQNWTPGVDLMTDDDSDGIYEITILLEQGSYQYKFVNGLDWDGGENVPGECNVGGNREIVVGAESMTVEYCFNQCTAECVADPDPSDITFRVNMTEITVAPEGVWVMGGFTSPQWQSGAIEMLDSDGDGIYEVTVENVSGPASIQYKFANGDPNTTEETGDFFTGGCGVGNGLGGFNRTLERTGEAMILDVVCYNYCVNCDEVSVDEVMLGEVNIYPNPSYGTTYVEVANPKGYTLRMSIVDITGKTVRENVLLNATTNEINTKGLNAGLYFLNIVNELNDRSVYKLIVR